METQVEDANVVGVEAGGGADVLESQRFSDCAEITVPDEFLTDCRVDEKYTHGAAPIAGRSSKPHLIARIGSACQRRK